MNKHVCKISRLNSKRLLRKLQKLLGGYFILPHPVLLHFNIQVHVCTAVKCSGENNSAKVHILSLEFNLVNYVNKTQYTIPN